MEITLVLKQYLYSEHIKVSEEWIVACLDYLRSAEQLKYQAALNNQNLSYIKKEVINQWLNANLLNLKSSCLVPGIQSMKIMKLNGNYCLQMNEIYDIGAPLYSQVQKFRKDNNDNTEVSADKTLTPAWEPKPSRMLKMKFTDGSNFIYGIEYSHIPCLSLDLQPGIKILVKGPLEVRRGVMLLTKENITILGGCVDAILQSNAPHNIILRKLNLPEIDHLQKTPIENVTPINEDDDDDFFGPEVERAIYEAEELLAESHNDNEIPSNPDLRCFSNANAPMTDDEDDLLLAAEMFEQDVENRLHENVNVEVPLSHNFEMNSSFDYSHRDQVTDSIKIKKELPFQYLCHLDLNCSQKKFCTIKAFVVTLRSKLEVVNDEWKLTTLINDGTRTCLVDIGTKVLQRLIGASVSEFKALKNQAKAEPHLKASCNRMVGQCQQEFVKMCCLFSMEIGAHLERPKVLELSPITDFHYQQFSSR